MGGAPLTPVPADYAAAIAAVRPDLEGSPMTLHTRGWDSHGVEAGPFLFKFPKSPIATERLRREAGYLALIRPRVPLTVPELRIHDAPLMFSEHRMIPGDIIETRHYDRLTPSQRDAMAAALGAFYAAIHAIPVEDAVAAGAVEIPDWPSAATIFEGAAPIMPASLHPWMRRVLDAYVSLPPDEPVTGYFDGHGWNMAFDHERGVLNGVYDFADGGIGPRHREFSYGNLTSHDLAERTIVHYERLTGLAISRRRVALHTAVRALSEAPDFGSDGAWYLQSTIAWHDHMNANPELAV